MLSRDDVFSELGIGPVWRLRETPAAPPLLSPQSGGSAPDSPRSAHTWEQLADAVSRCTPFKLHTTRTQGVLGVGDRNADWLIIGEAPGADEDAQGEPFVGQAGKLLDAMLAAIDLKRGNNVYITNVLKSRPPGNRNPEPDEVAACEPFLFRQIDVIQPKVIVPLGKFAAQCLLKTTDPITRLRGREYKYRNAILMPTYHPAYLLRTPSAKREVWEDMKKVRDLLGA